MTRTKKILLAGGIVFGYFVASNMDQIVSRTWSKLFDGGQSTSVASNEPAMDHGAKVSGHGVMTMEGIGVAKAGN
jgi:hypothetical protein